MIISSGKAIRAWVALAILALVPTQGAHAQTDTLALRQPSEIGSYLAGLAALNNLDASKAAGYFMDAAGADWDNPLYVSRAFLAYMVAGRVTEAATIAQHVLDLDPRDDLARLTLGSVALKQRRYASAEQVLSRVPEGSLIGLTAGVLRAWAQLGSGDDAGGIATIGNLAQSGFGEFLLFHRAIIAEVGGQRDQAIELSTRAYEADPFVTRVVEAHVRILGNAGRYDDALAVLDSYRAEGLSHPLIDSLREPIEQRRRPGLFAPTVQAGAAEMFHGLGSALAQDGSTELGVAFLQLARYLEPDAAIVAMTLGELFGAVGRHEKALDVYATIGAGSPLRTSALVRQAETLDLQGQREEALSRLRNTVASAPDNPEALGVLGDVLRYDEQWEEAAQVYTRLIDTIEVDRPRDWRFYYVRGITYERSGQWENAERDFKRALDLNPEQPQVLTIWDIAGWIWA